MSSTHTHTLVGIRLQISSIFVRVQCGEVSGGLDVEENLTADSGASSHNSLTSDSSTESSNFGPEGVCHPEVHEWEIMCRMKEKE